MLMRVYHFEFKLFEFVKIVSNQPTLLRWKTAIVVVEKRYGLLCFTEWVLYSWYNFFFISLSAWANQIQKNCEIHQLTKYLFTETNSTNYKVLYNYE